VANWVRLYDESLAKLSAKVGKESLSLPEVLNRLSDPDVPGARPPPKAWPRPWRTARRNWRCP
jgi:hypothetical protein